MSENKALYCIVDASEAVLGVLTDVKLYTSTDPWTLSVTVGCVPLTVFDVEGCVGCLAYETELLLFHSVEAASTVIQTLVLGGAVSGDYHVVELSRLRELLIPFVSIKEVSSDGK